MWSQGKALTESLDANDIAVSQQCEPTFTNYTSNFSGCLDYIFFSGRQLRLFALLEPVTEAQLFQVRVLGLEFALFLPISAILLLQHELFIHTSVCLCTSVA